MEEIEINVEELDVQTMVNETPLEELVAEGEIENEDKNNLSE